MPPPVAFLGTGFTSSSPQEVVALEHHLFRVDASGVITSVVAPSDPGFDEAVAEERAAGQLRELPDRSYLLPGFVDLHCHAPQWTQAGTTLDLPLDEWLQVFTFPLEARFKEPEFARFVSSHLVRTLLVNGTTTALYFGSVDAEGTYALAETCAALGQRALVGKVVMDDPQANPAIYRDRSTDQAMRDTETFIERVRSLHATVPQDVLPVVTPRFLPSVTDDGLRQLGLLAAQYDVHIQSHCSEGDWEHNYVMERFGKRDAFAHDDLGLLTDKTVLAHCVFIDDTDAALMKERGAAIAHCPISNAYFANGVLPVRRWIDAGLEIGLGSDISGSYSPSMLHNLRQTVISSRMLEDGVDATIEPQQRGVAGSRVGLHEAFYLATAGAGESLGLPVGRLAEGYAWDVQVVNTNATPPGLPVLDEDPPDFVLAKILYQANPEHVVEVWVQGEQVVDRGSGLYGRQEVPL